MDRPASSSRQRPGPIPAMGTGLRRCDEDGSFVRQRLFSWEATEKGTWINVVRVGTVSFCHTGEGRCPWLVWVPAFAGKTGIMTVLFLSNPSLWVKIRT